jgi:hypothetical protein
MIHVATVHWRSDRWIDVQLRYLERFLPSPYRVYAFLNDVPGDHRRKFFYSSTESVGSQAKKLNLLADMISFAAADPTDLILFVDGDAFPVNPLAGLVHSVDERRLVAVQRYENNGDLQPHPCFCLTTVGFWQDVGGDWNRGHEWPDLDGRPVTDVGGNLLAALETRGIDWLALRRVNTVDIHPLFFALYGTANDRQPVVYHHGAGFRKPKTRVDHRAAPELREQARGMTGLIGRLPDRGPLRPIQRRFDPAGRSKRGVREDKARLDDELVDEIARNERFWERLVA